VPALLTCLYLPYRPFEDWSYLRFLLPAYPPLLAGFALVLAAAERRSGGSTGIRFALTTLVILLTLRGLNYSNAPTDLAGSEPRYRHVAAAVAAIAPEKSVLLSFQHSGSLRYYTGRDVLRWDLMDRAGVAAALDYLSAQGYRLYWVGEASERETVRHEFEGTRFLAAVEGGRRQVIGDVWLVDLLQPR